MDNENTGFHYPFLVYQQSTCISLTHASSLFVIRTSPFPLPLATYLSPLPLLQRESNRHIHLYTKIPSHIVHSQPAGSKVFRRILQTA